MYNHIASVLVTRGLRDYGTATWIGGDKDCDHLTPDNDIKNAGAKQLTNTGSVRYEKHICRKCGAIRQDAQLGLEATPEEYVANMVAVFREVRRVLRKDGTLWLNLGDSYATHSSKRSGQFGKEIIKGFDDIATTNFKSNGAKHSGLKEKDLVGIPWRVAFALQADGWYLRQDIIWHKPGPMPESVTDRCTKAHEYVFLLSKSQKYYYDYKAIMEEASYDGRKDTMFKGGVKYEGFNQQTMLSKGHERWKHDENGKCIRNKRSVWTVATEASPIPHFAMFPTALITPMILAGCPEGGVVLDPFIGSGTTAYVAAELHRDYIGIELNKEYVRQAERRLQNINSIYYTLRED